MSRTTWAVDRVAAVIVGAALVAAGFLAFVWRLDVWSALPEFSDSSPLWRLTDDDWWPWAVAAGGVVLLVVGLRWLFAHLPSRGVGDLNLPGTGEKGRLRFSGKAAASTAAEVLATLPAVRSAKGNIKRDRGQLVVELKATVDPDADLAALAQDADQIIADLASVTGRRDLYGRVQFSVSSAPTKLSRVD